MHPHTEQKSFLETTVCNSVVIEPGASKQNTFSSIARRAIHHVGPAVTGTWGLAKMSVGVGIATSGHFIIGGALMAYGISALVAACVWQSAYRQPIDYTSSDKRHSTESDICQQAYGILDPEQVSVQTDICFDLA